MLKSPRAWLRAQFTFKRLFLLFLLLAGLIAGWLAYLDYNVRSQFEGKRFALPARVYARPLELYEGMSVTPAQLQQELEMLNYAPAARTTAAGSYRVGREHNGTAFDIYLRPFDFWDGLQAEQQVRILIRNDAVHSVIDTNSKTPLDLVRLDPATIGGIYPGKNEDRQLIRLKQAPAELTAALLAIEDQRFYDHPGVDVRGLARAVASLAGDGRAQGGSTITQQLVKNFFLTPERTLRRKVTEMAMALLLERRYEKDDILETYLNEVYFGQDKARAIHGFGLASQFYFAREVEQLELHQSALLVAMLKGPMGYHPRRHPERALERRNLVLREMHRQQLISQDRLAQALQQPLGVSPEPNVGLSRYPAFLDLVMEQLRRDYDEDDLRTEGLRIFTTLDPFVQGAAEKGLTQRLQTLENSRKLAQGTLEGAAVITDRQTGEVQAVVGGRRAGYAGFNRALSAKRQVGSLIKPAIYLAALEQPRRYTLATPLDDSPFSWQEPGMAAWEPQNYDQKFHGTVPLWQAFAHSYNVAAVRLGTELGLERVSDAATRLGLDKPLPPYASSLLGTVDLTPMEVTRMYHTIASGGFRTPLRAIREVLTMDGQPLRRYGMKVEQTVAPAPALLLTAGLQQAVEAGTGRGLQRYLPASLGVAGKTGTTDGLRDSWFAGFTGDKLAVVWVGSDTNQNTGLTGSSGALTVWGSIMAQLNPRPLLLAALDDINYAPVDVATGAGLGYGCEGGMELPFIRGSEPDAPSCNPIKATGSRIKGWFDNLFGD